MALLYLLLALSKGWLICVNHVAGRRLIIFEIVSLDARLGHGAPVADAAVSQVSVLVAATVLQAWGNNSRNKASIKYFYERCGLDCAPFRAHPALCGRGCDPALPGT
jgi:hypothetical protein